MSNYFKKNALLIGDIEENEINLNDINKQKQLISYLNGLRKNMSIKDRLKFNITFEENINLLKIKKETDILIPIFQKVEEINNNINLLNRYNETDLNKLKKEISNINITIKFIKRDGIFNDISKKDFIETLESNFMKSEIDYLSQEINNFYLFIYLLKTDLYDEKSYKLAVGINED